MEKNLFISYWRTNFTKTVRICRLRENASPETVSSFRIAGRKLSDADVIRAEAMLKAA